jgi:endonuclease YncB( thermonuclease family)
MSQHTRFASRLTILGLSLATLLCCRIACAQEDGFTPYIDGRVLNVLSGSELVVLNTVTNKPVRVRLRGTDAPDPKGQPYGARSLHRLASIVNGTPLMRSVSNCSQTTMLPRSTLRDGAL